MRNVRWTPIGDRDVDAMQVGKSDGLGEPVTGVKELGLIVAIAKIVNGYLVPVYFSPGSLGHIVLPRTIVGRLQGKPCGKDQSKHGRTNEKAVEVGTRAKRKYKDDQEVKGKRQKVKPAGRQIDM